VLRLGPLDAPVLRAAADARVPASMLASPLPPDLLRALWQADAPGAWTRDALAVTDYTHLLADVAAARGPMVRAPCAALVSTACR
jgi:hypothetical protein